MHHAPDVTEQNVVGARSGEKSFDEFGQVCADLYLLSYQDLGAHEAAARPVAFFLIGRRHGSSFLSWQILAPGRSCERPHASARTGRGGGKQKALAEANVVIEQIDDERLTLDTLGDQIDAEAAEQVGEIGRMELLVAPPALLSSSAAGALMKRKPRAVSSRGSMRRSVRLSME